MGTFVYAYMLTLGFEAPKKLRVLASTTLDIAPGKYPVITRRDAAQREMSVLICSCGLIQISLAAARCVRHQHDHGETGALAIIRDNSVDLPAPRAEQYFQLAINTTLLQIDALFQNILFTNTRRLDVVLFRCSRHAQIVGFGRHVL